jgi:hypothetical protein
MEQGLGRFDQLCARFERGGRSSSGMHFGPGSPRSTSSRGEMILLLEISGLGIQRDASHAVLVANCFSDVLTCTQ